MYIGLDNINAEERLSNPNNNNNNEDMQQQQQ